MGEEQKKEGLREGTSFSACQRNNSVLSLAFQLSLSYIIPLINAFFKRLDPSMFEP